MDEEVKARRRKPPEAEEQDQKVAVDAALASAMKDPLVRTPAKPPDASKVDEKWDLEDDEDWVEGQSPGGEREEEDTELSKRRRVLKRDAVEAGTALFVHLVLMCIYIYIHVYDATVARKTKEKGFPGLLTYGGRWKYLTYWNLVSGQVWCALLCLHKKISAPCFVSRFSVDSVYLLLPLFLH